MIHYSCDRCHRTIDAQHETRRVVRIEVETPIEWPALEEADDDRDDLDELNEALGNLAEEDELLNEFSPQSFHYDLCPECFRRFLRDPLGADPRAQVDFSRN